jgi:hypothetical protein
MHSSSKKKVRKRIETFIYYKLIVYPPFSEEGNNGTGSALNQAGTGSALNQAGTGSALNHAGTGSREILQMASP